MAINSLLEIYKKKGKEFVEKLFTSRVTVNEKINGFSFYVEKNLDGTFSFYKKEQDNPITLVDRTLMSYYEAPIHYFSTLPLEVKEKIPYRWKFGFDYLPTRDSLSIIYDRVPQNGLILSCIIERDEYGNFIKQVTQKTDLDAYADILGVSRFPILFQGVLTEEQKGQVMEVVSIGTPQLKELYNTDSVVKALITVLNPNLKSTTLNDDLDKSIEGVIFRFDEKEGDSVLAKIIDPVFSELMRERDKTSASNLPNDTYSLTLLDVMYFILERGVESFSKEGTSPAEKYMSFVCSVFDELIKEHGDRYRGLDFREPDFLKSEIIKTNMEHITSEETRTFLEEDASFDSLFRIILSALRKYRRKTNAMFTPGVIEQFNLLIDDISSYLNDTVPVYEMVLPTFGQFRKKTEKFVPEEEKSEEPEPAKETPETMEDDTEEKVGEETDSEEFEDVNSSDAPSFLEDTEEQTEGGLQKVNVVCLKTLPVNNNDYKTILRVYKENTLPCVIVVPRSHYKKDNSYSLELSKKALSSFVSAHKECAGFEFIYQPTLSACMAALEEKYYPASIVVSTEELYESMNLQYQWVKEEYEGKIAPDFHIYRVQGINNAEEIMGEILSSENFSEFKRFVPKEMVVFYSQFISEYKTYMDVKLHQTNEIQTI